MNYKHLLILLLLLFNSCTIDSSNTKNKELVIKNPFKSNGFALIYSDEFYKEKKISLKLEDRQLVIFQKNLKKDSSVKIKNNKNNKSILATVGKNANYPDFNNSVVTKRIAKEIELDINEPYVEITEIINRSLFVAKKAKTFDEEKIVADKAPVETISINDLNSVKDKDEKPKKDKFSYIIKIADFYFKSSADLLIKRIKIETPVKKINMKQLSETNYRVFLGPFNNLISLKKAFNDINLLKFENIEIIKND